MGRPVKNLPQGEAPFCACNCGQKVDWNQRKNRWNKYADVTHYRQDAPYKHRDWLYEAYVIKNRTVTDIAAECRISSFGIIRYMKRFEIERRTGSDAHIGRQAGDKNPAWKGGIADWQYSSDWKRLARQLKKHDNYTCRDCGTVRDGRYLHVHHADFNKLNNDLSNLVTLCARCHSRRHHGYGR